MLWIDITPYVLGNDIFDEKYEGCIFFPDNSWILGKAYIQRGTICSQGNMNEEDIEKMNYRIQTFYEADDAILCSDYYENFEISNLYWKALGRNT